MSKKPLRRGKVPRGVCQGAITNGKVRPCYAKVNAVFGFIEAVRASLQACRRSFQAVRIHFICLCCTNAIYKREITALKELQNMAEVCERCTMLATKVLNIQQTIENLSAKSSSTTDVGRKHSERTYAGAVRSRAQAPRRPDSSQGHNPGSKVQKSDATSRSSVT